MREAGYWAVPASIHPVKEHCESSTDYDSTSTNERTVAKLDDGSVVCSCLGLCSPFSWGGRRFGNRPCFHVRQIIS